MSKSQVQTSSTLANPREDTIRAACFKRVDDGYVYRAPNPWVFGRSDHYLVTEAQRDAIVAVLVPRSSVKTPTSRLTKALGIKRSGAVRSP